MRQIINLILMTVVIGGLLLLTFKNINWGYFLIIQIILLLFIFNNASKMSNIYFFKTASIINLVLFILISIRNYQINESKFFNNSSEELYYIISFCISIISLYLSLIKSITSSDSIYSEPNDLYYNRKNDLDRLKQYVLNFEIVGLNGDWGTGKSYLTTHLKKNLKEDFYFIEIDLLTCNLDNINPYIINKFEQLLYMNKIIPRFSNDITTSFKDIPILNKFNLIVDFIFKRSNFKSTVLSEFQNEVAKLDKKVLVIYEDIDRINNVEVIKEIFAITEKMSCENIHFLYEYDEYKLINMEFSNNYLEKYIPIKLNLTQLKLMNLLRIELENNPSSKININMFNFINELSFKNNFLLNYFNFLKNFKLRFEFISIRKTKNFLRELELNYEINAEQFKTNSNVIVGFFLIKHFLQDIYAKFDMTLNILDMQLFHYEDEYYSLQQLMQFDLEKESNVELIKKIFDKEENQLAACALELLGVEIIKPIDTKDDSRINDISIRNSYKNAKISRIVRHLSYAGTSVLNDYDYAVQRICYEVLDQDTVKQNQAFNNYLNEMYNSSTNLLDNKTIFLMGTSSFENIFEAFDLANAPKEKVDQLIEFYFRFTNNDKLDLKVLKILEKIPFKTHDTFMQVLHYFNSLNIEGNFNNNKEFFSFLNKYMSYFSQLSIIDTYDIYQHISINENIDYKNEITFLKRRLEKLVTEIEGFEKSLEIDLFKEAHNDFLTIKTFLYKIIEIIDYPKPIKRRSSFNITETTFKTINHEEYQRLIKLSYKLDFDSMHKEIDESYRSKKLSLYELTKLLREIKNRK